jgi:hypothetical protein
MYNDDADIPAVTGNYDPETQLWAGDTSAFGNTFYDITIRTLYFVDSLLCVRRDSCGCCIGWVIITEEKYKPDRIKDYD